MNCYDSSQPVDEELMTSGVILGADSDCDHSTQPPNQTATPTTHMYSYHLNRKLSSLMRESLHIY